MSGELESVNSELGANNSEPNQQQQQEQLKQQERQQTRQRAPQIGRSATLQSGSLQELKVANSSRWQQRLGHSISSHSNQQDASSAPASSAGATTQRAVAASRQVLRRQRSSNQTTPAPSQRGPSKSMLLLAQNQHIPQAAAQIDSYIQKQQGDFMATAMQYASCSSASLEHFGHQQQNQSSAGLGQHGNQLAEALLTSHNLMAGHHQQTHRAMGGGGAGGRLKKVATIRQDSSSGAGPSSSGAGLAPSASSVNTRSSKHSSTLAATAKTPSRQWQLPFLIPLHWTAIYSSGYYPLAMLLLFPPLSARWCPICEIGASPRRLMSIV